MNEDNQHRALPVLSDERSAAPSHRDALRGDSGVRVTIVLAARWLLILALIGALHVAARQRSAGRASAASWSVDVSRVTVRQWFGETADEVAMDASGRQATVRDGDGNRVGRVVQTLPDTESVTGYQGPSNLLIGIDADEKIIGVRLISSDDTVDHVRSIERSESFFSQFQNKPAAEVLTDVDVVSGATLTSLAMIESVAMRLGNDVPDSARFPDPISINECEQVFPAAVVCKPHPGIRGAVAVVGEEGHTLGKLVRTGPLADRINGYQGPTELLLGFDPNDKLIHVSIRRTFDNQPYASYVEDEPWYWDPFLGKTPAEIAPADPESLGIEGVSGATLSTVAAAETLIEAAQGMIRQTDANALQPTAAKRASDRPRWNMRWTWKDSGTVLLLIGSLWFTFARSGFRRRFRWIWQVMVVVLFGFVTGNLLSIALLAGWGTSGVPWRLAPGLAAVVLFAFAVPLFTKSPIYCAQLCPHGALQQWLRGVLKWKPTIPMWLNRCLLAVPGLLCVAAYWLALSGSAVELANWEPFDAYVVWIGISGSIIVAVLSLGLAALTPMGYCRFACPTGRVLSYTRRHARSGRWGRSDWAVVMLAVSAWAWVYWQS